MTVCIHMRQIARAIPWPARIRKTSTTWSMFTSTPCFILVQFQIQWFYNKKGGTMKLKALNNHLPSRV